jgi:hypothetical protein
LITRIKTQVNLFKIAAQKYKNLSLKLFYNLEDLKEILKREKNWKHHEVTRELVEFQTNRQNQTKATDEMVKQQRKLEFQRAITRIEDRGHKMDSSSRFMRYKKSSKKDNSLSDSEDSPLRIKKDLESEEDKILQGLLNTRV